VFRNALRDRKPTFGTNVGSWIGLGRPFPNRSEVQGIMIDRRSLLAVAAASGSLIAERSKASTMNHIAMLGDSIFDNGAYVGGAPDVRAQAIALLPGTKVSSAAQDGAVMTDIESQLRLIPDTISHIVVSIGGNDAIRASGVLDESASTVAGALGRLGLIQEEFSRKYATMVNLLLDRRVALACCTIYEPRFQDQARRRAAASALTLLNDVITREVFRVGANLIDLRLICDKEEDFANAIEPSGTGGAKIARALARFVRGDGVTSGVFAWG
jgi:hypothetical protein